MNTNPTDIYGNLTWLNKQVQKLYCLIESLGGGGSITINPTNGYIPVRTSATTFGDSAIESNASFTRITHTFDIYLMRFFISAEEGFRIETFSYDVPESSQIDLNATHIGFGVAGDGVNANININQNSVAITAYEYGNYNSGITINQYGFLLSSSYINVDNGDDQLSVIKNFNINGITTTMGNSHGGDYGSEFHETENPGYYHLDINNGATASEMRITYDANTLNAITTYIQTNFNDAGNNQQIYNETKKGGYLSINLSDSNNTSEISSIYDTTITNNPIISTYINIGDGEYISSYTLEKSKISFSASAITADSGCTFKIYILGVKTRYNFSNVYTFASNAAALASGLVAGDIYRHSGGALNIVY